MPGNAGSPGNCSRRPLIGYIFCKRLVSLTLLILEVVIGRHTALKFLSHPLVGSAEQQLAIEVSEIQPLTSFPCGHKYPTAQSLSGRNNQLRNSSWFEKGLDTYNLSMIMLFTSMLAATLAIGSMAAPVGNCE